MKRRIGGRFPSFKVPVEKLHVFPKVAAEDTARLAENYTRRKSVPVYPRRDGSVSFTIVWKRRGDNGLEISVRVKWTVGRAMFANAMEGI